MARTLWTALIAGPEMEEETWKAFRMHAHLEDDLNPGKNPELLEWVGEEFDPEEFDLAFVNKDLATVR